MVFKTEDSQFLRVYIYVGKVLNLFSPLKFAGVIKILSLRLPNSVSPAVSKCVSFLAEIGNIVLITITKLLQEDCVY